MPSSYRHCARDGDGDGQRDLFESLPDVFASVANYFIEHQWQPGQPVVVRAQAQAGALVPAQASYEPAFSLAELAKAGFRPVTAVGEDLPASLIVLDGVDRSEEHTSELQSLMRISYAVFCFKKKNNFFFFSFLSISLFLT